MIADDEDLQESEASEIYVKIFKNQEVSAKGENEFPCANGTLRFHNRPWPSLMAEGKSTRNIMLKLSMTTKKAETQKMRGRCVENLFVDIMNNFVWSFYDPDSKTFPIPLKYVYVTRHAQTRKNNVSEHFFLLFSGPMRRVTLFLRSGTGTARFQILRKRLLEGYRWVVGWSTKIQKIGQTRKYVAWSFG